MKTIDGHTFYETLLTGGWVIDAGCRGFNFANSFWDIANEPLVPTKESKVYAIDIENFNNIPPRIKFKQAALTNHSGETECYLFGNGTGNFIKGINGEPGNTEDRPVKKIMVPCITLDDIYNEIGTDIDLLKLDIEGAEYAILDDKNFKPIPKQITVEFHEHTNKQMHDAFIERILDRLCRDYHLTLHIREWPRYKFLDCLFVRKDVVI